MCYLDRKDTQVDDIIRIHVSQKVLAPRPDASSEDGVDLFSWSRTDRKKPRDLCKGARWSWPFLECFDLPSKKNSI